MAHGPRRAGLEKTLKAMKDLKAEQAAIIAAARGLADAVDADPANAALWREYRATLIELSRTGDDGDSDGAAAFLLKVTTPGLRS